VTNINRKQFQAFPYHLVEPSPWPLLTSFAMLTMAVGAVMYFHGFTHGGNLLILGFLLTLSGMILWFRDVIAEATYLGDHTKEVQSGLTIGVALFIVSEIFAFLSIFWAFFHSSLAPAIEIGASWPPFGIEVLDPFAIPLLNTILLLSSGDCLTWIFEFYYKNIWTGRVLDLVVASNLVLPFNLPRYRSTSRIGPHNFNILSLLISHLLGDAYAYKDPRGHGTNIRFYYSIINLNYALYVHSLISELGYSSSVKPSPLFRDKRQIVLFNTYTFSSFNWIYEAFYINGVKVIPHFIEKYLTPQGLAHWIMDDGCIVKDRGVKIATNSYTYTEVLFLSLLLQSKFSLNTTVHKTQQENQFCIYIKKGSL